MSRNPHNGNLHAGRIRQDKVYSNSTISPEGEEVNTYSETQSEEIPDFKENEKRPRERAMEVNRGTTNNDTDFVEIAFYPEPLLD